MNDDDSDREPPPLSAGQLRAVFDSINDAVFVHDATGNVLAVNQTAVDMYGYSRAELRGGSVAKASSGDRPYTRENAVERIKRAAAGESQTFEWKAQGSDGNVFWVEVSLSRTVVDGEVLVLAVVRNIDERKEAERRFQTLIDNLPGLVYRCRNEPGWPMDFVGGQCRELTGYGADAIESGDVSWGADVIHPDDRERVRRAVQEATAASESFELSYRIRTADGDERWVWERGQQIDRPESRSGVLEGFITDVTERREYEQKLRRFRRAVEAAGHAIYMTDPDGAITYVNPAFERITGYDGDEAIGRTPSLLRSGEMSDEYYEALWATISAGDVWEEAIRDRRKSGELYHAHQTIAPLTDGEGEIEAYVAIQTDVTEQKERETQLQQYERAVEGSAELIAAIDDDYRYLFANEAYREFYGFDADSVRSRRLPEVIGAETFEAVEPYVEQVLAGRTVQYRMTRARPTRPDRTFEIRYSPLTDEAGEVWGAVAMMRDVTERIERERHLVSLDRMLRHNLRNELNVIQGQAETIARQAPDDIAELAGVIEDAAERVLAQAAKEREIVDVLVEPSTPATLNLADVVDEAVASLRSDYPHAEITTEIPEELTVTTVPEIEYAVHELVENALSHVEGRPPEVDVTARYDDETVELGVADNGPGIPPQERAVIVDGSEIEPLLHSNGMGLWLVKRIANRADGTIRFEEREPRGSVVTVVLPRNGT
ncbi:MAG: PAS domain S-box protein [Haloferacaceae archaeon]